MVSPFYASLTKEEKTLVNDAMEQLSKSFSEEEGMAGWMRGGEFYPSARPSMYYALGLMLLNEDGCAEKVERICNKVIDSQLDAPDEPFHGCYHHKGAPECKKGQVDYKRLGTYGRYYSDCFYERTMDAYRLKLKADPRLAPLADELEHLYELSVIESTPLVWTAYEPNSREFVLMCFTMLLEHFSDKLSPECVKRVEHSAKIALEGAIARSTSEFAPLNTNIQCMHVFTLDYFGVRLNIPEYCAYALEYAEKMVAKYLQYHAAAEFNSPTYCGVDLDTLGFWSRYGSNERLKELGLTLEHGIWRDMMEFYNPAMMNFCGPYSRAYELEMSLHTSYHGMMYRALGEEKFPWHPYTAESSSNPLAVFGHVNMPEDCKEAVFAPKDDVVVYHQFRELSERGEPGNNDALCTATGWITPDLMTGGLAGSENPSHQLHPLVVFWRGEKGLGTIKVLRCTPDNRMNHMHTVFFNAKADKKDLTMDVDFAVNRDVKLFYEIEYPGIAESAEISDTLWKLPGLDVAVSAKAPALFVEKNIEVRRRGGVTEINPDVIRVCYMSEALKPETKQMHFDLHLELTK